MNDIRITPLHRHFAARVEGIDNRNPLADDQVHAVNDAVREYAVVVLPNQSFDERDQVRFSRAFGGLELPRSGGYFNDYKSRVGPELFDAGNLDNAGEILAADAPLRVFSKGNLLWHTDSSFNALPVKWSLLMSYIIPPEGGETEFADMRLAYDCLPPDLKGQVDQIEVVHDLWHSRKLGGYQSDGQEHNRVKPVVKPLVRQSESGRKALYLGAHAASIVGMSEREGEALLARLLEHATKTEFVYRHQWALGDLVIWDNRCTLHRALPFKTLEHKRDMRRTTTLECAEDRDATMVEAASVS
jgi:alpha-ketoglutarate-dependent 2,4-dichlorophenoxyacetate dioxygenase